MGRSELCVLGQTEGLRSANHKVVSTGIKRSTEGTEHSPV